MTITSKRFVFGAVTLAVMLGAAFLLRPVFAGSLSALQQAQTPTPIRLASSLAEVWSQFCVVTKQVSYVLVAIPENATFEVVQPVGSVPAEEVITTPEELTGTPENVTPTVEVTATPSPGESAPEVTLTARPVIDNPNEVVCKSLGTTDGKQLVLCRGPKLSVITLSITADGQTEEFPIMPPGCAADFPTQTPQTEQEPFSVLTPTVFPTIPTSLPTNTPPSPSPTP